MPALLTLYSVSCDRFEMTIDGISQKMCFSAHWSHPEADSPQTRKEVLTSIAREIGIQASALKRVQFHIAGYVPERLASENRASVSKALPAARAKCIIEFGFTSMDEIGRLNAVESHLEQALEKTEVGFVDGNDIEPGLYRIFCFGPKKAPLLSTIENELRKFGEQPKRIR